MTPAELQSYLIKVINNNVKHAVMLWGKPGIGKSSIVRQLCSDANIDFTDLRLSQLMPSDLRGVPVPQDGITHWYPPSFLPQKGRGVLFMDELNMAPPALQGVAQQLILDRRVGDYCLPDGWFVWAAGNNKSDRAAVYEMPAPLANRFIHLNVEVSLDDFKQYAYRHSLSSEIIGFLSYRPDLLHKPHASDPNWPSPRTWEMASDLMSASLPVEPAVGEVVALELESFVRLKHELPDTETILNGSGPQDIKKEPSILYATVTALVSQIKTAEHAINAFMWLISVVDEEWVHCFCVDLFPYLHRNNLYIEFSNGLATNKHAREFLTRFTELST